jgi:hypothetical protein
MTKRLFALTCLVLFVCIVPAFAVDKAAWLAKVEGFYASEKNRTPIGDIPFAMDMVKESDGSMHGRTWASKDSYFDFRFSLNEKGELLFHETGALPGGLVQSHVLEVVKEDGDTLTFETRKAPGLLVAQVTADGKRLHVNAVVRGRPHVDLQLARVTAPEALAVFRAMNERNKGEQSNPLVDQVVQRVLQGDLADYAGEYELPQAGETLKITIENGKLFGQPTADSRRELKAAPDGSFSVDGEPFSLRFLRDDTGKVTHALMSAGGQELVRFRKLR